MRTWYFLYMRHMNQPIMVGFASKTGIEGAAQRVKKFADELSTDYTIGAIRSLPAKLIYPFYAVTKIDGSLEIIPVHGYDDFLEYEEKYGLINLDLG